VVTRRYEQQRSALLTTNKAFGEWSQVFPNATCVGTLVDRLLHRAEIVVLDGESYRFKEAQERAARKAKSRTRAPRKALTAMLQPNDLPLVCLPIDLSDEAATKLVEFLHDLTDALERHYGA